MDTDNPYVFHEKPAAKSSTSIFVCKPGNVACPTCGCRDPHAPGFVTIVEMKPGCKCICHGGDL